LAENSEGPSLEICIGYAELELELERTQIELKSIEKIVELLCDEIKSMAMTRKMAEVTDNTSVYHNKIQKEGLKCSEGDSVQCSELEMNLKNTLEEIKSSKLTTQRLKQESVTLTSQLTQTGRNNPQHEKDNHLKNNGWTEVNYKLKEPVVRKEVKMGECQGPPTLYPFDKLEGGNNGEIDEDPCRDQDPLEFKIPTIINPFAPTSLYPTDHVTHHLWPTSVSAADLRSVYFKLLY
jgi:hypothetical protein